MCSGRNSRLARSFSQQQRTSNCRHHRGGHELIVGLALVRVSVVNETMDLIWAHHLNFCGMTAGAEFSVPNALTPKTTQTPLSAWA